MIPPTDDEFLASSKDLHDDQAELAKSIAAAPEIGLTADSFLSHLEDVAGTLVEKGAPIALDLLEKAAVAAIQGALERRK